MPGADSKPTINCESITAADIESKQCITLFADYQNNTANELTEHASDEVWPSQLRANRFPLDVGLLRVVHNQHLLSSESQKQSTEQLKHETRSAKELHKTQ